MKLLLLFFLLFFSYVLSLNEVQNTKIGVAPRTCDNDPLARPCNGYSLQGNQIVNYPSDFPCPCPKGSQGGAVPATGTASGPNTDAPGFVDEVLYGGFVNPASMVWSDNTNELFVATLDGFLWRIDLSNGQRNLVIDMEAEVGTAGDRGLMSIELSRNFAVTRTIYMLYVVDPIYGEPDENMEEPSNQRLIRLMYDGMGGIVPGSRVALFGGGEWDGPPICYNTHAVGDVKLGLDGSLFVTVGDGAHWNWPEGDFGQDKTNEAGDNYDVLCGQRFGVDQDIGAFRSQTFASLAGKLLRLRPDTGAGVCGGIALNGGFQVDNPFCDGDPFSVKSRTWSLGFRNPFRMTVKPLFQGEQWDYGPGVAYIGDVGLGSYEEINAANYPGANFGWPCWEGGMPMADYRDSPLNNDPAYNRIQVDGQRITCNYLFQNVRTELPFYYYSRYFEEGGERDNNYLGQGFRGNTIAGLSFYNGNNYPPKYREALFILDFSQWWIKALWQDENKEFTKVEDFADLFGSEGGKVTLASDPEGNLCYASLSAGQIRCIRYTIDNVAPSPKISMDKSSGIAPLTVHFTSDGTFDREGDDIFLEWDFGDGSLTSDEPNPIHTFTTQGVYDVVLKVKDVKNAESMTTARIYTNNKAPTVKIISPTTHGVILDYSLDQVFNFQAQVEDEDPTNLQYRWEFQLIHNNHIHPNALIQEIPTFSLPMSGAGGSGHSEGDRVNFKIVLEVTDSGGLKGRDTIEMTQIGLLEALGNVPPNVAFQHSGGAYYRVNQPIRFDASGTIDDNVDLLYYRWDFGDNTPGSNVVGIDTGTVTTSHIYSKTGTFNVTLTVKDNFGAFGTLTKVVHVFPEEASPPACNLPDPFYYKSETATCFSHQRDSTVYFTLDGTEPTLNSTSFGEICNHQILIPFEPEKVVTLKAKTHIPGSSLSPTAIYQFTMKYPPCNTFNLGINGTMKCVNELVELDPPGLVDIPIYPWQPDPIYFGPPPGYTLTFVMDGINGVFDDSLPEDRRTTMVNIWLDRIGAGCAVLGRASYDFTSDGIWDRQEVFQLFALDGVAGDYEDFAFPDPNYRFSQPVTNAILGYQPLVNGTVMFEMWLRHRENAPLQIPVRYGNLAGNQISTIQIPYKDTYRVDDTPLSFVPLNLPTCPPPTIPSTTTTPSTSTPTTFTPSTTSTPKSTLTPTSKPTTEPIISPNRKDQKSKGKETSQSIIVGTSVGLVVFVLIVAGVIAFAIYKLKFSAKNKPYSFEMQ